MACFVDPQELEKIKTGGNAKEKLVVEEEEEGEEEEIEEEFHSSGPIPALNIAILIVGSRGDVQPFIAFGKGLKRHGHNVRIVSHINFRKFVQDNGLEFYPLKGDPEKLMEFMVNHPDMITVDPSEIKKNQRIMSKIYDSTWAAVTSPQGYKPDVLISNPPVNVHVHLMQKLQVPLYIMFTMPWSPTNDYMHPLAPMQWAISNKQSYRVVDKMVWVGLGALQNKFRLDLGLPPVNHPNLVNKLKIPMVYCMSPHLAPKPTDWGKHIDVVGFWFLDLKTDYSPPKDLLDFLDAGDPPMYIGFGSIVVSNPKQLSENVIEAIKASGLRAVVGSGWAKIGEGMNLPDTIKRIDAVPHDWLFTRCSAVCHHGGAGTTAAGLKAGLPTIIVPFFGDQPFWGSCVSRMGVGPPPIPIKELTKEKLTQAILFCTKEEVKQAARELGEKLRNEDGVDAAVKAFHKRLPIVNGVWRDSIWENMKGNGLHWVHSSKKFTERSGLLEYSQDAFTLQNGWEWTSDWTPEITDSTDPEGWRYASRFGLHNKWKSNPDAHKQNRKSLLAISKLSISMNNSNTMVRTRKLIRTRRFVGSFFLFKSQRPKVRNDGRTFTLFVEVIEARNLTNKDSVGLSDPFCVLKLISHERKSQKQKTKVIENNLNPVWKETMWFEVTPEDSLFVHCWDRDPIGKDNLGKIEYPLKNIFRDDGTLVNDVWIPFKGKDCSGDLHLGFALK